MFEIAIFSQSKMNEGVINIKYMGNKLIRNMSKFCIQA